MNCIFCRQIKATDQFNIEHVIPDSINGFYKINNVCITCNSILGSNVDCLITNHALIKFKRDSLAIKGKSGDAPNPFSGTHVLANDSSQKIRFDKEKGKFRTRLVPKINFTNDHHLEIILDGAEANQLENIIDKSLKRKNIPKNSIISREVDISSFKPEILMKMEVDVVNFQMAIAKIAYEFAIDSVPGYQDDTQSSKLAQIILKCDHSRLASEFRFMGNGFDSSIVMSLNKIIEFSNNNHYLILLNFSQIGLVCIVNIFDIFYSGLVLSPKTDSDIGGGLIGINNLDTRAFEVIN